MLGTLRAFARGRLLQFGVATALRGPPFVVRALAVLLVPWMAALAAAGPRWFPSRAVHVGWLAFDAVLCGALWSLSRRWRPRLARALAAAVSADAALTAWEALAFNVPRLHSAGAALAVAVAVAAPLGAAVLLWSGIVNRGRA